jgi:CubicO group peptidase (beta-lactamase class C family)
MALFFDTLFLKVYGTSFDSVDAQVMTPLLARPLECQDRPSFMAFGTRDRPGRLKISPRDFCRFGLLYLRGGAWRGRQIVSADHVQLVHKSPLPLTIPRTQAKAADMLSDQRSIGSRRIPDDQTDHFGSYSWAWWVNGKRRSGQLMWPAAPPHVYACLGHAHGKRGMAVVPAWDIVLSWNDTALDRKPWPDQQTDPHPLNEVFRLLDQALAGPDE